MNESEGVAAKGNSLYSTIWLFPSVELCSEGEEFEWVIGGSFSPFKNCTIALGDIHSVVSRTRNDLSHHQRNNYTSKKSCTKSDHARLRCTQTKEKRISS